MKEQIILVAQSNFRNQHFFHETIQILFSDIENVELIIPLHSNISMMIQNDKMKRYSFKKAIFKLNNEVAFMKPLYKTFLFSNGKNKELLANEFSLKKMATKIVLFSDGNDKEIIELEKLAIFENVEIVKIPIIIEDMTNAFDEVLEQDLSLLKTSDDIFKAIQNHKEQMNLACNNIYFEIAAALRDRMRILKDMQH